MSASTKSVAVLKSKEEGHLGEEEEVGRESRNSKGEWLPERDSYRGVAGLDDLEDNVHKGDSVKAEEIEKQTVVDRVDSNVAQMNDGEEDDERDCEVVSCNDWQVR